MVGVAEDLDVDDDVGYMGDTGTPRNHDRWTPDLSPNGPISTPEAFRYFADFLFPEPLDFLLTRDAPCFPTRAAARALAAEYKDKPLNVWDAVSILNERMDSEVVEGSISGVILQIGICSK